MVIFELKNVIRDRIMHLMTQLDIGAGEFINKRIDDVQTLVFVNHDFQVVFIRNKDFEDFGDLELYGMKNTNSVNYYVRKFPSLANLESHVVRTKRWS